MESIKPLAAKREGHEMFSADTLQGQQRKAKVFEMFRGEAVNVTLRAANVFADAVVDVFGQRVMMVPVDKEHFTVNVLVEVSPPFFSWVVHFGDKMVITNPPEVRAQMRQFIEGIAEAYKE